MYIFIEFNDFSMSLQLRVTISNKISINYINNLFFFLVLGS